MHCLCTDTLYQISLDSYAIYTGYEGKFTWKKYAAATQSQLAPVSLFKTKVPSHSFRKGLKLEAVDLMDPK